MKPSIILLLITLINWSCSRPADQVALKAEIMKANSEFSQALASKNVDALLDMYTSDARLMFPHMPAIQGKENIRAFFQQSIDGGLTGINLSTEEVNGTDEIAMEMGRYELMAGGNKVDEGNYLVEWKKVDGRWLLHRDMPSTDMPVAQPVAQGN